MIQDKQTRGLPGQISTRTSDTAIDFRLGYLGRWGAWIVLVASLLISTIAWYIARGEVSKKAHVRFEFQVKSIESGIHERLKAYELLLLGGAGLFEVSDKVTREDWRVYIKTLTIDQHYPGIQGVGFSRRILPSEKSAHLRQIRSEGFPQYTIKPDGERSEYTSIIFLEPFDWRNQRAFGYDMFSEATRKEAMVRARDTGIAALSGKVTLVQETDKDVQTGFLIYVAVYRKGEPLGTAEQRRKALMGYVYSPFRMNDFMQGLVVGNDAQVKLQIFDGDKPLKETLLYQSGTVEEPHHSPENRHFATHQSILEYAGHRWLLDFVTSKYFEEHIETGLTNFILFLGITISLLLFGMVLSLTRSRGQAIALASTTVGLKKANIALMKEIAERKQVEDELKNMAMFPSENPNPVLRIAKDGTLLYVNQAGFSLLPELHLQVGQAAPLTLQDAAHQAMNNGSTQRLELEHGQRLFSFIIEPVVAADYVNLYGDDITDRKQVEETTRESEERYRTLVENANDIVFRLDNTGHITFVNPAALRIMGYEEKEIIGRHYPTFIRLDMQEEAMKFFGRQFVKGIPNTYSEYPVIVKGGHEIWLGQNTQLIFQDGKVVAFQAVARDITDRRRIEEELRRNQYVSERLSEETAVIAEIGRVIGSTLNIEEVYERFAAEARKLIPFDRLGVNLFNIQENTLTIAYVFGADIPSRKPGNSPPLAGTFTEEVIHRRTSLIIQPESVDEIVSRMPGLFLTFQTGLRSLLGVPLFSRDEVIGVLHFRTKKPNAYKEQDVRLAERIGAQIAGAIANAQLFSDLKKTENAMRESEGRFRALVEQAAVGVAEIEMSTGRFFTVNRRLCEMVGRTEEEMLATTFQAITHPEDLHLHEKKTVLMLAGEIDHYSMEKRYLLKDGASVWVNITVSPLWKQGETPGRNIAVVEDITERKRMEEEILALSITDQLTGLHNRRGFITLAGQQLKLAERNKIGMLLFFADLDELKWINDTLGHEEGDKALIEAATIFKETFRTSDIIARLGGDEYAALVVDITEANSEIFTARLQSLIDTRNNQESRRYRLSISVGSSYFDPENPCSLDELMAHADQLMYEQKQKKKGTLLQDASLSNGIQ